MTWPWATVTCVALICLTLLILVLGSRMLEYLEGTAKYKHERWQAAQRDRERQANLDRSQIRRLG